MTNIVRNLNLIRNNVKLTAQKYKRDFNEITLVAVSKSRSIEAIKDAVQCGQKDFGENRVQEAIVKIKELAPYNLTWHYLGRIQSNKTKLIAENFSWVHSLTKFKHAAYLNQYRPINLPLLNVCIQINISEETSKDGIDPTELVDLSTAIATLPRLKLRGLMAIPAPHKDFAIQLATFQKLASLAKPNQDLSMGMSNDYVAAIAAGATIIRVGTAIFKKAMNNEE